MRTVLVLALLLGGCVALEPKGDEGPGPESSGAPTSSSGPSSSGSSGIQSQTSTTSCDTTCTCPYLDGCGTPDFDPDADVVFVLNASYPAGSTLRWVVHNNGTRDYAAMLPTACSIGLYTESGRRVYLGPCYTDFVQAVAIPAGNDTDLGQWNGGECVREERYWYAGSCAEWRALPPGTYQVRRTFCAYGDATREDCSAASRSGAQIVLT